MAKKKNKKNKNKIGGIINKILTFFCGLAAIVTMVISIYDCCSSLPPTLTIHYNGNVVANGVSRNVLVCVDDTTIAESYEPLFPVISNTTSRTAKEFALAYTMTVDSVEFMPRLSYFNQYPEGNNTFTLKYTETSMRPQTATKEPICLLKLKGNTGVLKSSGFATHEGAEKPFKFNSTAKFLYVDSKNLDLIRWKNACRNAILNIEDIPFPPNSIKADIFFCSKVHGKSFEPNIPISYPKEVQDMAIVDTFTVVPQGASGGMVASLEAPILSDTIGIISSRYKKNVWTGDSIEVTIDNGYKNDTTLYAVLHFQNLSTDFIEAKYMPVVLKSGENEFAFVVDNNQKFIGCTFISKSQYEDIDGGENLSEKLLNNVITKDVIRLFILPILLSILASLLYSYYKDDEDDNDVIEDDIDEINADSENNKIIKIWNGIKRAKVRHPTTEEKEIIIKFLNYLKHEKMVKDPNVLMLYALICVDTDLAEQAFEQKGNVDITFVEIVNQYRVDFEQYKDTIQKEEKVFFIAICLPMEERMKITEFILEHSIEIKSDSNMELLWGIGRKDLKRIKSAIEHGVNVDITYEEFIRKFNKKYGTAFADKEPITPLKVPLNEDEGCEEVK